MSKRLFAIVLIATVLAPPMHAAYAEHGAGPGGTVHAALGTLPGTLQPVLVNDVPSGEVTGRLYEGLLRVDAADGSVRANLATWTTSADGLTHEFEILRDALWSDGAPIVAADWLLVVKAVARSAKTPRKPIFREIEGFNEYAAGVATSIPGIVAAGSRLTVRVQRAFCPGPLSMFTFPALPAHIFGKYIDDGDASKNLDAAPENLAPPVASGPFRFVSRLADRIVLERNPLYWQGPALVDGVTFELVSPASVPSLLADGTLTFAAVQPAQLPELETDPRLRVSRFLSNSYTHIGWNVRSTTAPGLADRRLRQALAYGLDIEGFIGDALRGEATKVVAHHPPVSWASPIGLNPYGYDPVAAQALIEEAGYALGPDGYYARDGRTLGFTLVTNSGNAIREALMQKAVADYAAIGVKVMLRTEPFATLAEKLLSGSPEIEAWIIGLALAVDPDPFSIWHSSGIPDPATGRRGFNSGGFTTPALDAAIESGRTGDCSIAARKVQYDIFNRILNEEQPYNFGFAPNVLMVSQAKLIGFDPGTFNVWRDVHRWELAKVAPTDQCKNGGWQDFGIFKNQGDCVSFVATKGKNPQTGP